MDKGKYTKMVYLHLNKGNRGDRRWFNSFYESQGNKFPLFFVKSVEELKPYLTDDTFIVISARYAHKFNTEINTLLDNFPNLIFNFEEDDICTMPSLKVLDLRMDHPKNTTCEWASVIIDRFISQLC